jgi:hypothetical protein
LPEAEQEVVTLWVAGEVQVAIEVVLLEKQVVAVLPLKQL